MNAILHSYNGNLTKTGSICRIMRPPRPSLKIKHEINYGIKLYYSRDARKLKLCLVHI